MRWWLALLLALTSAVSHAHTMSVAHLDVTVPGGGQALSLELDLGLRDIALSLPLDGDGNEQVSWGELLALQPQLEQLVFDNLTLSNESGACSLRSQRLATRTYEDGVYAHLGIRASCPAGGDLQLRYRLFFDVDPQHRVLVTVHGAGTTGTAVAIGRNDSGAIALPANGTGHTGDFLREGFQHILIGYDHLAFLVSLLLTATLLRRGARWLPVAGLRPSAVRVLGLVTAFTAAHSITLTLAALGWVTPATRWVEIAIAASVVLAALNNLWPLVTRRLWAVAFGFGLIHGFGFAGALGELGLPQQDRLLSLLAFNLGVELGQVAVVCLVLPGLFAIRSRAWYPRLVLPAVSLAIAAVGGYWLLQRLA